MIRISALNDSSDDESQSLSKSRQTTKEAQESAALALYNRALSLLRQGDEDGARGTFCQLLDVPFVRDAEPPEDNEVLVEPGLVLKYSTYKNLGSMSAQKEDYSTAMKYYLEAVVVDSSDVTVWYKIGSIALKLHHFPLARHAFEQGLECQPRHWPCLDHVITVLYALNNYEACLVYISRALQRDPGYIKGICFMEKIYDEQPSLRRHMGYHFSNCDASIFTFEVDQEEADEFINEALDMRAKKELMCRHKERPILKFTQPFTALTWMNLGSCLISLYDHIAESKPPITFSCKVDLSDYTTKDTFRPLPVIKVTTTADNQTEKKTAADVPAEPSSSKEGPDRVASDTKSKQTLPTTEESAANTDTHIESKTLAENTDNGKHVTEAASTTGPITAEGFEADVTRKDSSTPTVSSAEASDSVKNIEEPMDTSATQVTDKGQTYTDSVSVSAVEGDTKQNNVDVAKPQEEVQEASSSVPTEAVPGTSEAAAKPESQEKEPQDTMADELSVTDVNSQSQADTSISNFEASSVREPARRGPKRKRFLADTEKRRSARVRNTGSSKHSEDEVKIRDLVVSLLPTSLTEVRDEDMEAESSQEAAMDTGSQENTNGTATTSDKSTSNTPQLTASEEDDVLDFMKNHQINSGIIDLLNQFLIALAQRALSFWPEGLTALYVKAYSRLHKHIILPGYLCKDEPDERLRNMGKMILVHAELKIDKWFSMRSRASPTSRRSGKNPLGSNFANHSFHADLSYLDGISQCQDIFVDEWANFGLRVFWMKAKFEILDSDMDAALDSFETTNSYLEYMGKEQESSVEMFLPHVQNDSKITQEKVKEKMESLQRCQSQDKVQDLADSGEYEKVIQLLTETFNQDHIGSKVLEMEQQERQAQLLLLTESLLKVKDYKRGIIWGEVCLNESLQKYYNASSDNTREEWINTMTQILDTVDKCLLNDKTAITNLTSKCLVRLTQNVMALIELAFDVPESASNMAIPTMLPWFLLYKLVRHEEDRNPTPNSADDSFAFIHNGSMTLLELVHEQFGRRSWCCNKDGSLLLFIVAEALRELKAAEQAASEHPQEKMLESMLEQCFYCLYGHPNRKKAKHLQDHSSSQISLTWERAVHVFEFFKPKTMPEYDSLKTSTVSAELESLLRRIYIMVPTDLKQSITVEDITAYIEGTSDTPPTMPEEVAQELLVMSELYYLLADFYFKNKEQGKAIKFYMQDLCWNPLRFDSWAGMALARASKLEQKLSNSELKSNEGKNEGSIWKYAVASLRSFQRALDLDSTNSKLWIEYGSLAYQLHAHASRQLRQLRGEGILKKQSLYPLSEQGIEEAKTKRTEMLEIAEKCYRKAGECEADENAEEWLHHYMLGKVAEKKDSNPKEYLEHYKLALHYLHNDRARYPRKITDFYSPPHLAVETLEVFYRLHASIMKYLLKHSDDAPYPVFEMYTKEAADSPFAHGHEKGKEAKERESAADDSSNSNMAAPVSSSGSYNTTTATSTPQAKKKCNSTRMDHTYSKQRSIDSARSDADSSNEAAKDAVGGQLKGASVSSITSDSFDSMQSPIAMVTSVINNQAPIASFTATVEEVRFTAPHLISTSSPIPGRANCETPMNMSYSSQISETSEFATPVASFANTTADETFTTPTAENVLQPESSTKPVNEPSTSSYSEEKRNKTETLSPDTTCVDDVDINKEGSASQDNSVSDPQPSTTSEILSPHTSQSLSQDSVQLKDLMPQMSDDMDVSADSSKLVIDIPDSKDGLNAKDLTEMGAQASAEYSERDASVKMEVDSSAAVKNEAQESSVPQSGMDMGTEHTATDNSSQDSATAAELEHLKSEISFLNAGSTEMTSPVYIESSDEESLKDTKESERTSMQADVKIEVEDDSKEDEDMTSRNEALEALKSELQELSAAAGPGYDDQDIKEEENLSKECSQKVSQTNDAVSKQTEGENEKSENETLNASQNSEVKEEPENKEVKEPTMDSKQEPEQNVAKQEREEEQIDGVQEKEQERQHSESDGLKAVSTSSAGADNIDEISIKNDEPVPLLEGFPPLPKEPIEGDKKEEVTNMDGKDKQDDRASGEKDKSVEPPDAGTDKNITESSSEGLKNNDKDSEQEQDSAVNKKDVAKGTGTPLNAIEKDTDKKSKENDNAIEGTKKNTPEKNQEMKEMFTKIMRRCMKALSLCLSRFPHHYKSLYRLAHIFYSCDEFKNLSYARDMLLGDPNWAHMDHMSSPGLFQDRKSTNFFQGLWRIPIEEIDRSGSFACHMLRSLQLLFPILVGLKDAKMLFNIHLMLFRTPDQGRKYLRDSDRLELARIALENCIEIMDDLVKEKAEVKDRESRINFLLEIFKVWQHCVAKSNQLTYSRPLNKLLRRAYFTCMKNEIEEEPSVLEQAIRFCQQEQQLAIKSPTTPEPSQRSFPSTPTTKRGHPLEGFSVSTKTGTPQTDSFRSSPAEVSGSKAVPLKGITPIGPRVNLQINPKTAIKLKPLSVRLGAPVRPKVPAAGSGQLKSSMTASSYTQKTQDGQSKKLSASNVPKKPETTSSTSATSSTDTPLSLFSSDAAGGLTSSQVAAFYAQMAQMSPELLAQYSAAYTQTTLLEQMALASTYGIQMAAMPFMYGGAGVDPSVWSAMAAAQVFQESSQSSAQSTPPPRQSSLLKSSTSGGTVKSVSSASASSSSSQQQKSTQKQKPTSSSISEPPKKVPKMMTPVPWTQIQKTTTTATTSLSSSTSKQVDMSSSYAKQGASSLSTKTSLSASTSASSEPKHLPILAQAKASGTKTSPGLKLSAKTSQLYAVRMSSALAKLSQQKGLQPSGQQQKQQQKPIDAPPPPKVSRKIEASSTSFSSANLDSLNMLATAAQTHKLTSMATARPTKQDHPRKSTSQVKPQPPPAPSRSIKGPPTLKRAKHGGHSKHGSGKSPAHQAHSSPKVHSVTHSHPLNLSSHSPKVVHSSNVQSKATPPHAHLASASVSFVSGSAVRKESPMEAKPVSLINRPVVSSVQPGSSLVKPSMPAPQTQPAVESTTGSGVARVSGSTTSMQPPSSVSQSSTAGYGRGKPSNPSTLAPPVEVDDSSDDCIIISSGQDSESD